jgi:hypothetical protein
MNSNEVDEMNEMSVDVFCSRNADKEMTWRLPVDMALIEVAESYLI